jgi:hypothetical protein
MPSLMGRRRPAGAFETEMRRCALAEMARYTQFEAPRSQRTSAKSAFRPRTLIGGRGGCGLSSCRCADKSVVGSLTPAQPGKGLISSPQGPAASAASALEVIVAGFRCAFPAIARCG